MTSLEARVQSRIGIMQGRLSPRPADRLQAFPHGCWRAEFDRARQLELAAIEWIFEAERVQENPLVSREGRAHIRQAVSESGVQVRSVCGDYFMVQRLAGDGHAATRKNVATLLALLEWAQEIGAERILIPLLESASVNSDELRAEVTGSLCVAAERAAHCGIVLGLEMEIPGTEYRALIDGVGHPAVKAYYDVGNSTAQGLEVASDVRVLLDVLHAVHLKDRRRFGSSVPLGTGDSDFAGFFRVLSHSGFTGDFVLQHYFDTDPEAAARAALNEVRKLLIQAAA